MRTRTPLLAFAALVVSCGGSSTTGTSNGNPTTTTPVVTTSVALQNFAFSPANIQVASGAVVTFTNNDATAHNVTFSNATVGASGDFTSGAKTLAMPTAAGDYPFHCTIHAGMSGTVTVK